MIVKHIPSPAELGARPTADGRARGAGSRRSRSSHRCSRPPPTRSSGGSPTSASFSGTLASQGHVWNATRKTEERFGNLLGLLGKDQTTLGKVGPGDIAAVAKLTGTHTGDTLIADRSHAIQMPPLVFPNPTLQVAVEPESKADLDKLGQALHRLEEEEPAIRIHREEGTNETILTAMGDAQVDVIVDRLKRKFGAAVRTATPRVPYRETIRKPARVDNKFKRQTGGHGQYGHVVIEFEPAEMGAGFEFGNKIVGGVVPRQYIPAVEKGLHEAMAEGVLAGYPVVDLRPPWSTARYHTVDSSEMAFKIAASQALKRAFEQADPILLEPILEVEVDRPRRVHGRRDGPDHRQARPRARDGLGRRPAAPARPGPAGRDVPLRHRAASITQGRGRFTSKVDHYAEVPHQVAEKVIAEHADARRSGRQALSG